MARIAIFAGHGGSDPGALGNGLRESDLNLAISNAVSGILRGWGYDVINNRTTDVNRSITQDANLANSSNVAAMVEIHFNSNPGTPGTGSEAFVSLNDTGAARRLAESILAGLAGLGFRNR
ncbi:MAG: N-acetylmuramoyl-L-alanine amidase, partial [Defluviitaleaceae bacterium]|nr:N-acetylmuramoyl-L-alanine amidase [Defluviitaleaceae bacterium]